MEQSRANTYHLNIRVVAMGIIATKISSWHGCEARIGSNYSSGLTVEEGGDD